MAYGEAQRRVTIATQARSLPKKYNPRWDKGIRAIAPSRADGAPKGKRFSRIIFDDSRKRVIQSRASCAIVHRCSFIACW